MRKIIIAFDGKHYSDAVMRFAKELHEKNPILLTGVFLPQVSYANLWSYADGLGAPMFVPTMDEEETDLMERQIELFEKECIRNGIEFNVRKDLEDLALPELKKESRFSDMILVGEDKFYTDSTDGKPSPYLSDALHKMECPVLVISESNNFPTMNILAYDGTESSVYAIRQFIYLLPELHNNPTFLIYAEEDKKKGIPFEPYIEEYASRHFPDLTVSKLDLDPQKYFTTWAEDKKNAILVTGAFGRSSLSQLFKKSFVMQMLEQRQIPVFIAHT
jgi:nucleotide-binding universal stress UspA family protein